jgi:hypothetical protein
MRTGHLLLLPLLLGLPTPARAVPPPLGFSVESAVSPAPGGATARLAAVTSFWLDGDLEAEARLGFGSAPRTMGRAADALTPALGLRWGPDVGRWRPLLGVEAGVQLATTGSSASPVAAARAGVQLIARRQFSLSVTMGWRWGAGAGAEARVGLGYAP